MRSLANELTAVRKPDPAAPSTSEGDAETHETDHETVRPKALARSKPAASATRLTGIVEDYSDLAIGEDELETKLSNMKVRVLLPANLTA